MVSDHLRLLSGHFTIVSDIVRNRFQNVANLFGSLLNGLGSCVGSFWSVFDRFQIVFAPSQIILVVCYLFGDVVVYDLRVAEQTSVNVPSKGRAIAQSPVAMIQNTRL